MTLPRLAHVSAAWSRHPAPRAAQEPLFVIPGRLDPGWSRSSSGRFRTCGRRAGSGEAGPAIGAAFHSKATGHSVKPNPSNFRGWRNKIAHEAAFVGYSVEQLLPTVGQACNLP